MAGGMAARLYRSSHKRSVRWQLIRSAIRQALIRNQRLSFSIYFILEALAINPQSEAAARGMAQLRISIHNEILDVIRMCKGATFLVVFTGLPLHASLRSS